MDSNFYSPQLYSLHYRRGSIKFWSRYGGPNGITWRDRISKDELVSSSLQPEENLCWIKLFLLIEGDASICRRLFLDITMYACLCLFTNKSLYFRTQALAYLIFFFFLTLSVLKIWNQNQLWRGSEHLALVSWLFPTIWYWMWLVYIEYIPRLSSTRFEGGHTFLATFSLDYTRAVGLIVTGLPFCDLLRTMCRCIQCWLWFCWCLQQHRNAGGWSVNLLLF